jgi:hypothetical protein
MGRADLPPDTIAFRRTLVAGFAAFGGGVVLVAAGSAFVLVRYVLPGAPWTAVVHFALYAAVLAFVGGGGAAVAVMSVLDRWHHWRGVYRCVYCDRPLRRGRSPCVCWGEPGHPMAEFYAAARKQHRPRRLRHYRRRLGAVLATYAALVPVVVAFVALAPRRHPHGFAADVVVGHFLACALIACTIRVVSCILEALGRGRRFRLRARVFEQLFSLWPVTGAFAWACAALLR